ncbi:MAG: Gfo/Idh/MocA family oxidoreductase [Myxococcales bacterium]|nr:Gfo/Idh/MocA family oxidoreductase [Myxococcales bacterium]
MSDPAPLRIGILGAARIAPMALVRPARAVPGVTLLAVAARDPEKARAFARKHGIPRVHPSYDALLCDPEIDAVYNPLPNSLHCEWSIRALRAGKHVLCEKPMAANAAEAERMAQAAADAGRLLVEAFHYRYHPLAARLRELIESGALGRVQHLEAHMCVPFAIPGDIRYRFELAGGANMDVGCYVINLLRFLAAAEPEVTRAEARLSSPQVDRYMAAEFRFADGRTARMTCALFSASLLRMSARVQGERGELRVFNPIAPHFFHRLKVIGPEGSRVERIRGDSTYTYQLRAFLRAVREGKPMPTDATDAIANMRVIDAVYEKAGLRPRGLR